MILAWACPFEYIYFNIYNLWYLIFKYEQFIWLLYSEMYI